MNLYLFYWDIWQAPEVVFADSTEEASKFFVEKFGENKEVYEICVISIKKGVAEIEDVY